MSILSGLDVYQGAFEETNRVKFSQEDLNQIASAVVKDSKNYPGKLSACFYLKSGGTTYIPLSNTTIANVGESIDPSNIDIVTISRTGDEDKLRVDF